MQRSLPLCQPSTASLFAGAEQWCLLPGWPQFCTSWACLISLCFTCLESLHRRCTDASYSWCCLAHFIALAAPRLRQTHRFRKAVCVRHCPPPDRIPGAQPLEASFLAILPLAAFPAPMVAGCHHSAVPMLTTLQLQRCWSSCLAACCR